MKKDGKTIETLEDALYDLIHNSPVPAKVQAESLGVSYSRLLNCCLPSAETAFHHTRWLIPQTLAARNPVLIDYIERRLGRVAISLPDVAVPKEADAYRAEMMKIARELGEVAAATEKCLGDRSLSRSDRAVISKEAWDLITQAMKFYVMIEGAER